VAKTVRIVARGFGRYYEYDKGGKHIGTVAGGRAKAEKRAAELGIKIEPHPKDKGVGYGKPPMSSQFKKGQSGNPDGRPPNAAVEADKRLVALTEERDEAVEGRKTWIDIATERKETAQRLIDERDNAVRRAEVAEQDAAIARRGEAEARADRDRERGYIEGLLDGRHPERPQLPWESRYERIQSVGNISFEERYR
jgi:hypothetical protein